jgi:hypothetical protein
MHLVRGKSRVGTLGSVSLLSMLALLAPQASEAKRPPQASEAKRKITPPKTALGFEIGDDYQLATYTQLSAWWKTLASESDRVKVVDIGQTEEGRPQLMAVITSPQNMRKLARYQEIARRLALAEGLTDEQARALAEEGKAVVWIDGGLHASEVLGAHQLMALVYEMVSRDDPETMRILKDTIILAAHANPDGMELVSNWYMREAVPAKRRSGRLPRLYQKYIGHDNNRDFYASNMKETTNINRQLYLEWFPQIVYNHHQSGPAGTVLFAPPFRDPFNYNLDPLVPAQISLVGSVMHSRFIAENKPGATMRSGGSYSTWFNGGLRTTSYFHNMVGILTETIGNPTPMDIPLIPDKQLPSGDLPFPVGPQKWHFRQSIEYSMTANRAVLDYASRFREELLLNAYRMAKNSIARGNQDSWSVTPSAVARLKEAAAKARPRRTETTEKPVEVAFPKVVPGAANRARAGETVALRPARLVQPGSESARDDSSNEPRSDAPEGGGGGGPRPGAVPTALFASVLRDPALRQPRGYIIPSVQADFPTATKFVNALLKTGVTVHRASDAFDVAGRRYPAGSWIVKTAQPFRPHVLDMFEPQDHPNDFRVPGGRPTPPYDVAGYTLAFQMGVQFDRILEAFDGPFEKVNGLQKPIPARIIGAPQAAGYLISHELNDASIVTNRLLKAGGEVYWLKAPVAVDGRKPVAGTIFVAAQPATRATLEQAAAELGVPAQAVDRRAMGEAFKLGPVRVGLWDQYGGSMSSGWLRWLFEQFEFTFQVAYPPELDAGRLRDRFDVLVLPDGAMPGGAGRGNAGGRGQQAAPKPEEYPPEYRGRLGRLSVEKTLPQLRTFLQDGGTIVAMGSSSRLAQQLGLPIKDGLTQKLPTGQEGPLPREKFYVPGSVLRVDVDNTRPLAYGMPATADVFFENSEVFRLPADGDARGIRRVAWFSSPAPLRSGWAWGQAYLNGTVGAAEASVGPGKLFLLGVEAAFRAQPHGTFKLLFNAIHLGNSKSVTLEETRPAPSVASTPP